MTQNIAFMTRIAIDFRKQQLEQILRRTDGLKVKLTSAHDADDELETPEIMDLEDIAVLRHDLLQNAGPVAQTQVAAKLELFKLYERFVNSSPFLSFAKDAQPFSVALVSSIQSYLDEKQYVSAFELVSSMLLPRRYPPATIVRQIGRQCLFERGDKTTTTARNLLYEILKMHGPASVAGLWEADDFDSRQQDGYGANEIWQTRLIEDAPDGFVKLLLHLQSDSAFMESPVIFGQTMVPCFLHHLLPVQEKLESSILFSELHSDVTIRLFVKSCLQYVSRPPQDSKLFDSIATFKGFLNLIVCLGYAEKIDLIVLCRIVKDTLESTHGDVGSALLQCFSGVVGSGLFQALVHNQILAESMFKFETSQVAEKQALTTDWLSFQKISDGLLKLRPVENFRRQSMSEMTSIATIVMFWQALFPQQQLSCRGFLQAWKGLLSEHVADMLETFR